MRTSPLLPAALLLTLSTGACQPELAPSLDSEREDSISVQELSGTWCSKTSANYERIEFSRPDKDSERQHQGTFRSVSPIHVSSDLTVANARVIQDGKYYAQAGRLLLDIEEERIWSEATGAIGEEVESFDLNKQEWNYNYQPVYDLEKEYVYHRLELSVGPNSNTYERHPRKDCDIELGE